MTTTSTAPATTTPSSPAHRFVRSHPITSFVIFAYALGWPLLTVHTLTGTARTAVGMLFTYGVLLGLTLMITRIAYGPSAVTRLLRRLLRWRFGLARWAVVVLAMPALTLAVAAASGTFVLPPGGWWALAGTYVFQTLVVGALQVNLAEEAAWSGLVQTRLTERHGLGRGALLTAPWFVGMHLPLQFAPGWSWSSVAVGVGALVVIAPFFRYLMGETLAATGGSLLAVGVLHASFNASGNLIEAGGWQFLPALLVLVLTLAVARRWRVRPAAGRTSDVG